MNMIPKYRKSICFTFLLLLAFNITLNAQQVDAKSKILIDNLTKLNGGYEYLTTNKDVEFKYIYHVLGKGKDVSVERYIFDGEHSWARYNIHEIHVSPNKKGTAVQSLTNSISKMTLEGKEVTDAKELRWSIFLRKVNFYWFTMMHKLKDPGTIYKYLGTETVDGIQYDKVNLTFDSKITKKKLNDEFVLYFNPKTHLIDQFYFTIVEFGFTKPNMRMTVIYDKLDDLYIPVERKSYNDDGTVKGIYTFKNIKFNNNFKPGDFKL